MISFGAMDVKITNGWKSSVVRTYKVRTDKKISYFGRSAMVSNVMHDDSHILEEK